MERLQPKKYLTFGGNLYRPAHTGHGFGDTLAHARQNRSMAEGGTIPRISANGNDHVPDSNPPVVEPKRGYDDLAYLGHRPGTIKSRITGDQIFMPQKERVVRVEADRREINQERVKDEYGKNLDLWLAARSDRNRYLMPLACSDPRLIRIDYFTFQLFDMLWPQAAIVDLGFGPLARDIGDLLELSRKHGKPIQLHGFELVPENVASALKNTVFGNGNSSIMNGRLREADISQGILLPDSSMDAVILAHVIQHMGPQVFYKNVVPEISRVLKTKGILELIFKTTPEDSHKISMEDISLGKKSREFWLYNIQEVLEEFGRAGMHLYEGDKRFFGGVITWLDPLKPVLQYAGMYLVRDSKAGSNDRPEGNNCFEV